MPDDEPKHEETQPEGATPPEGAAPAEGPGGAGDALNPQAIAARVDRLGGETDIERVARDEEAKLYERKIKDKSALETAASKRLAKIGEGKVKRPSALVEGMAPEGDPLVRRAAAAGTWVQQHQQTFAGIVVVALLGFAGFAGYTYWQDKRDGDASAMLAQGIDDERGHISDKTEDDDTKAKPLYPTFKTTAERREAALAKYREVQAKYAGTGAAILARLAEASLVLDGGDAKTARADYEEVSNSALGKADAEVRGRALEGIGFADEALSTSDSGDKAKHLTDALAAYKKLADDVTGFKELGQYHQARVFEAQGDKAKAVELLKDVQKRVTEPGEEDRFSYLKFVVEDRLRDLDPTALPPKTKEAAAGPGGKGPNLGVAGGGANKVDMNDPQIKKILEQLRAKSGTPPIEPPGAPGPAPTGGPTP